MPSFDSEWRIFIQSSSDLIIILLRCQSQNFHPAFSNSIKKIVNFSVTYDFVQTTQHNDTNQARSSTVLVTDGDTCVTWKCLQVSCTIQCTYYVETMYYERPRNRNETYSI